MKKLVRDKIPEIMKNQKGSFYIADENEFKQRLIEKLKEEVAEYAGDESLEELADILEVIEAIIAFKGFSKEELERVRIKKKEERGSFEKRIILE